MDRRRGGVVEHQEFGGWMTLLSIGPGAGYIRALSRILPASIITTRRVVETGKDDFESNT